MDIDKPDKGVLGNDELVMLRLSTLMGIFLFHIYLALSPTEAWSVTRTSTSCDSTHNNNTGQHGRQGSENLSSLIII